MPAGIVGGKGLLYYLVDEPRHGYLRIVLLAYTYDFTKMCFSSSYSTVSDPLVQQRLSEEVG